ncbi:hypothetical protein M407DRAFT_8355 [Tulasnella calospora MUT 4182]|uniref:EF-hand domain-containing protein n=1 Tax=Tulasnella calospora MUT 4182 TaxID=1051891 RepID=A0A0C3KVM4_9AGAM|nr:hypothetical protein M407DRAFT_8355 [Tulasnella calospora MUT 4182]
MSTTNNSTALQRHVAFWDKDDDGVISPLDLYIGFRKLGFRKLTAPFCAFCICTLLSYPSQSTWYPDWGLRIYVDGVHKVKHGSDSEVYNRRGNFNAMNFEEMFEFDCYGWLVSIFHWTTLYILLGPEDRKIKKGDVKALYEHEHVALSNALVTKRQGTLFWRIAGEVERRRALGRGRG